MSAIDKLKTAIDRVTEYIFVRHDILLAVKSFGAVKRTVRGDYRMWFDYWLTQVERGVITPDTFHTKHRQVIQFLAEQAYIDGLARGGVEEPLDADDLLNVATWVSGQLRHTWSFADALRKAVRTGNFDSVRARRDMWLSAIDELEGRGFSSAQSNLMVTWKMGQTEEHCETCQMLNGQRHRIKWFTSRGYIPQQNASETLECGGWQCKCGLYDDAGKRVLPA